MKIVPKKGKIMLFHKLSSIKFKYIFLSLAFVILYFVVQLIFYFVVSNNNTEIPVLVWWTPFFPDGDRILNCEKSFQCLVTNKRNMTLINAFLFYGSHINNTDFPLPRNSVIPWAIFHEESPKNYAPILFKKTQLLFNVTSTFSQKSDIPITLQYLNKEMLSLIKDKKYYIPIHIKNNYLKNVSPVLYVQSDCDTPVNRDYLVKNLSNYVHIDSYGKCLKNKTFPFELQNIDSLDLFNEQYLRFISKYKFIVAFENAICEDYITEKLWRPLIVGSIPIYLGSPTIEEWLPNKNSAILVKNFKDMAEVGKLINRINKNDTLYKTYLEHKLHSKISNRKLYEDILQSHPIPNFECYMCKKIHIRGKLEQKHRQNVYKCPKPPKNNHNSWNQHWEIGNCQTKALIYLMRRGVPYTEEEFDKIWKKFCY